MRAAFQRLSSEQGRGQLGGVIGIVLLVAVLILYPQVFYGLIAYIWQAINHAFTYTQTHKNGGTSGSSSGSGGATAQLQSVVVHARHHLPASARGHVKHLVHVVRHSKIKH